MYEYVVYKSNRVNLILLEVVSQASRWCLHVRIYQTRITIPKRRIVGRNTSTKTRRVCGTGYSTYNRDH